MRYNYVPSSGHIYHAPLLLVLSPLFILVCSRIYCHIIWLLPRAFSDKEYPPPPPSSNFNSLSWLHHLLPFFNRFYILSPRSRHYCFFVFFFCLVCLSCLSVCLSLSLPPSPFHTQKKQKTKNNWMYPKFGNILSALQMHKWYVLPLGHCYVI